MHEARPRRRNWFAACALAAAILATTACGGAISATRQPSSDAVPGASAGNPPGYAVKAADLLATLPVKGRAPKTGYDREEFGPAWSDTDHNGCDTRNDILARDLKGTTFKPGTKNCIVLNGSLADPYTATTIAFTRGSKTSSAVQIDHVVALSDAWQKGAQRLSKAQRTAFANDPLNLLAVQAPPTSKSPTATPPPGSPAARPSAARTSPGRFRSRRSTSCG